MPRRLAAEIPNLRTQIPNIATILLEPGFWDLELRARGARRVTDGTRTRNSQNHNLELYH